MARKKKTTKGARGTRAPAAAEAAPAGAATSPAALEWSPNHRACTATWMTLRMLDQSVRPFPSSGTVRMDQLTFFNAAASDEMRRFQATTLAKQLDNFFRQIDGAQFEEGKSPEGAVSDMRDALCTADLTMADLAGVVHANYRFWEEE